MKRSPLEGLQRSTRIIIAICGGLLAGTAIVLIYLMFFPVLSEEKQVIIHREHLPEETEAVYTQTTPDMLLWDDKPHTLSTWSAGVSGFSRSFEEFGTTFPQTTYIYTRSTVYTKRTTVSVEVESPHTTEETLPTPTYSYYAETSAFPETHTETVTPPETVSVIPVETDPPTPQLPVDTDPIPVQTQAPPEPVTVEPDPEPAPMPDVNAE